MKKISFFLVLSFLCLGGITAAVFYPLRVIDSDFVLNPKNVISTNYNYSVLQYATNITCPNSSFYSYGPYPDNFCIHGSGKIIGGWEIITFNQLIANAKNISSSFSDLDLGCTECDLATTYRVFFAGNTSYHWIYAGDCDIQNNDSEELCEIPLFYAQNIYALLIARGAGGTHRPDPAVHWIRVEN